MQKYVVRNLGEYGNDEVYLVKAETPYDAIVSVLCSQDPDWKGRPVNKATLEQFDYLDITHMQIEFPGDILLLCITDTLVDAKTLDRKI